MPMTVLLADSNSESHAGMASVLARCEHVRIVAEAKGSAEAVMKTLMIDPDLVLLDLGMLSDDAAPIRGILADRPGRAICIIAACEHASDVVDAVKAGARGCLPTDCDDR